MNWLPCEMHCHTLNSDGKFTVDELVKAAKEYDLSAIALTDHNTMSGWAEVNKQDFTILKGIEWTTYFGHMLVLDCPQFVDWRDALPDNIDDKISQIKSHGGIVGIAHPFELGSPMCTGGYWDYNVTKWENLSYMEAWSKPFPSIKTANFRAIEMWNNLLDNGYHIATTYGKDWHCKDNEDTPSGVTLLGIDGEITPQKMKKAIANGRSAVTIGPKFYFELFSDKLNYIGDVIESGNYEILFHLDESFRKKHWQKFNIELEYINIISNGGKIVEQLDYQTKKCKINLTKGWYRCELVGKAMDKNCTIAMTSCIYCK